MMPVEGLSANKPERSQLFKTYAQESWDTFSAKDTGNEAINKGKFAAKHPAATILDKFPIINVLVGLFSKKKTLAKMETAVDHFNRFNQVRMPTLSAET